MAIASFIPELRLSTAHTEHVLTFPSPSMCFLFAYPLTNVPPAQRGLRKGFSFPKTCSQKEIFPKPQLFTEKSDISRSQRASIAKPWEMLPIFHETHPNPWAELILVPQKSERIPQGMKVRENPFIYFSV